MKTYKCIKTVVFSVAVAIVVAGCRTVPMTGRTQLMLSFESRENAMGVSAYAEYMQKAKDFEAEAMSVLKKKQAEIDYHKGEATAFADEILKNDDNTETVEE